MITLNFELHKDNEGQLRVSNRLQLITDYRVSHLCSLLEAKNNIDYLCDEIEYKSNTVTPRFDILRDRLTRIISALDCENEENLELLQKINELIIK